MHMIVAVADKVACVRSGVLAFLAVLTALLCILKIVRLHTVRHPACHQYIIFYCASLECVIGGVHWLLMSFAQLDFVLQYLKLIQFLVMCHFYWTLATRALRRETLTKRLLIPFLVLACVYFTVISCFGIFTVESPPQECLQRYWLMLSAAEFVIVQLFMVAGFYITRRLNEISTLDSVRWSQKRDLWCIIIVFEVSALVGMIYDMTLQILGHQDGTITCSAIFGDHQNIYSSVFVVFMVMKLLLPIWVMLVVFTALPPAQDQEDLIPPYSEDGPSAFSASTEDQQYRQLYHPSEDYRSTEDPSVFVGNNIGASGAVKRSASYLDPIREEGTSINSPQQQTPSDKSDTPPRGKFYI
ncbi:hypothetical protein ScPMuIL_012088 [Solemya velum]